MRRTGNVRTWMAVLLAMMLLMTAGAWADGVEYDAGKETLMVTCTHLQPGESYSFIATRGSDLSNGLNRDQVVYLNQIKADDNGRIQVLIADQSLMNVRFYAGGNLNGEASPHLIGIYGEITSSISLPVMLTSIEEEAFAGGTFQAAYLGSQVTSIGGGAFRNCKSLIYVRIPSSVAEIAEDAFEGCGNLTISCVKDSAAWKFAQSHGYKTEEIADAE